MFQTDSRDLAADREAEEHVDNFDMYGESEVSSMDQLFKENESMRSLPNAVMAFRLMDIVLGVMRPLSIPIGCGSIIRISTRYSCKWHRCLRLVLGRH